MLLGTRGKTAIISIEWILMMLQADSVLEPYVESSDIF